jgi:hypothetical protein
MGNGGWCFKKREEGENWNEDENRNENGMVVGGRPPLIVVVIVSVCCGPDRITSGWRRGD